MIGMAFLSEAEVSFWPRKRKQVNTRTAVAILYSGKAAYESRMDGSKTASWWVSDLAIQAR